MNQSKNKSRLVIIICVVIAAVAIIAVAAFCLWHAEQERLASERATEIEQILVDMTQEADALEISTDASADRAVLLQQYGVLQDAKTEIQDAERNGEFALPNGETYDASETIGALDAEMGQIRDWFIADYDSTLEESSFPESTSADSITVEQCQAKLDALGALKTAIEQESIIWDGATGEGSEYASLLDRVTAQIATGDALLPEVQAAQAQAAEEAKANGFLGKWGTNMMGAMGGSPGSSVDDVVFFYDDGKVSSKEQNLMTGGTGTPTHEQTTARWERTGGIENGIVTITTSYGTTYYYNINTGSLTSSGGGTYYRM